MQGKKKAETSLQSIKFALLITHHFPHSTRKLTMDSQRHSDAIVVRAAECHAIDGEYSVSAVGPTLPL